MKPLITLNDNCQLRILVCEIHYQFVISVKMSGSMTFHLRNVHEIT